MEGLKHDSGKLRWSLLPWGAVQEVVKVVTFGASKYGPCNWTKLEQPEDRYFSALMRHLAAWKTGESLDPETGIYHLAHAGCNVLFLLWFEMRGGDASNLDGKASPSERCSCGHVHMGYKGCRSLGLIGNPCGKCRATCLVDSDDPEEFECLWRPITTGTAQQESRP